MMLTFLISLILFSQPLQTVVGTIVSDVTDNRADVPSETTVPPTEEINIGEIIFEHIGDEYEWHITEWKGKPIAIPLPCIVIEDGVHVFTVHHAAEHGYTLNEDGKLVNAQTGKRPLDLSITKNVYLIDIARGPCDETRNGKVAHILG